MKGANSGEKTARGRGNGQPESGAALAADAAVLGIAIVWGASYPVAKSALAYVPVIALILYRFAITAAVMGALNWREVARARTPDIAAAAALGVILFAIFAAETFGVNFTSATNTAFIISLFTVITPILDYGLAKRVPPWPVLIAAFISCVGVAVLGGRLSAFSLGDGLVLLAALLRAIMVVATQRLMKGRNLSSGALTVIQAATVLLLAAALAVGTGTRINPGALANRSFLAALIFLSLLCTIAAFYVQNAAVRRTTPTRVSFLMSTEPIFGLIVASLLLAEPISIRSLTGGALIVGGTIMGIVGNARSIPA